MLSLAVLAVFLIAHMLGSHMTGSLFRRVLVGAAALCAITLIALAAYFLHLNRLITETFEGRRWSVPAQVYAAPVELYAGAELNLAEMIEELSRLGYSANANLPAPGTYARRGHQLDVYLRAFEFPETARTSQRIKLTFDDQGIIGLEDGSGRPVPLVRLDPLNIGNFFPSHGEDRLVLTPEQVPELLKGALIAVEDANFNKHFGFDPGWDRAGGLGQSDQRRDPPGRQHPHPAAGQKLLPDQPADLRA